MSVPPRSAFVAPWNDTRLAIALRPAYVAKALLRSFVLPGLLRPPVARDLRARLWPKLREFELADRGRYLCAQSPAAAALSAEVRAFATQASGLALARCAPRWLCFRAGDYSLRLDDARTQQGHERWLEATLDLSASACPDARIIYDAPGIRVVVDHAPGTLALVERTAETARYERYLPATVGRRRVFRLRLEMSTAS